MKRANQQGNPTREPSTTARLGLRAESWYSLLPGESRGIKDYENVNLGTWRAATDSEYNTGHLPAGATLRQVITAGGDRTQTILTQASSAETVTIVSGDPSISYNADGSKNYIFSAGSSGGMTVLSRTGNVVHENQTYYGAYTVNYKVSSYTTSLSGIVCTRDANGKYSPVGDPTYRTWYAGYSKSTLSVSGVDTGSGSAILTFTPKAPSGGGGTIKVKSYTPEKTTTQKYGYYTHVPASGVEQTKTFLVHDD